MMHRRDGFTLIELMIVIVIIGLLASIATSFFWSAKDRALVSSMQSDLKSLATHQESHFGEALSYAGTVEDLVDFTGSPGVLIAISYAASDGWAANATHSSLGGHRCAMFMGDAPPEAPATEAGKIICD